MTTKTNKKTILFVEDNSFILAVYRNWLHRDGFEVESAADGQEALEKLPLLKPDLVILDLMMPRLKGEEVLRFLRQHPDLKSTPVLILSNAYLDEPASRVLKAGANERIAIIQCTLVKLLGVARELTGVPTGANDADLGQSESILTHLDINAVREARISLRDDARKDISQIRYLCLNFVTESNAPAAAENLNQLYQHVRFLCVRAGFGNCTKIAHLASALEALLSEIEGGKLPLGPSVLRTITQTVDCLNRLIQKEDFGPAPTVTAAKVLIVDDDPICRFAAEAAMRRVKLGAASSHDPQAALEMAQTEHYDVILLDINMPGMNGFEFCKQLRLLPQYKQTPVLFITAYGEFPNRAQAVLSGGNDLIAKPILPMELALKTMMHLTEPLGQRAGNAMSKTNAGPVAAPEVPETPQPTEPPKNAVFATGENKTDAHPVVAPMVPKVVEPVEPPRNAVFAKVANEKSNVATMPSPAADKPKAATNGDKPKAPAVSDDLKHAPQPRPPRDTEFHNRGQFTPGPSPVQRISPPQNSDGSELLAKPRNENQSFDKLTHAVTRIFFGDDKLTEMSLRLTHIALERCRVPEIINRAPEAGMRGIGSPVAGAQDEPFCQVTREVARIIFGGEGNSEMHLRLTRIALERYHVPDIITPLPETNQRSGVPASQALGVAVDF